MNILNQISQLLGLLAFIALIWLIVRAFRKHVLWGLAVMLLSPISATIFGIKYWKHEKLPFLAYITTFIPAAMLGLYMFTAWGGWNVVQTSLNIHEGIHSDTLTEQDAMAFIRSNLNFVEQANTDEHEQRKLDVMRKFLDRFESGMTEADMREINREMLDLVDKENLTTEQRRLMEQILEQSLSDESDSSGVPANDDGNVIEKTINSVGVENTGNSKPKIYKTAFVPIAVSDAKDFIGDTFKVKRKNGSEREYRLANVSSGSLHFERHVHGGKITFEVENRDIKELKVLTRRAIK